LFVYFLLLLFFIIFCIFLCVCSYLSFYVIVLYSVYDFIINKYESLVAAGRTSGQIAVVRQRQKVLSAILLPRYLGRHGPYEPLDRKKSHRR